MRKLAIFRDAEVEPSEDYPLPVEVTGLEWSKLMSPPDYGLWLCVSSLEEGATVTWPATHGDEALYVFEGELEVGGHRCPAGGAVIVESAVAATAVATQRSRIGHYGPRSAATTAAGPEGPPAPDGHRVHVVGPGGIVAFGDETTIGVRMLADSSCDTCRLSLFEVARDRSRQGRPHSHSADEIIFVVSGSMRLGAHELGPGSSLCIPGGVRYAEASGDGGCVFLNYRPHAADRTEFVKGEEPVSRPETPRATPGLRTPNDVVDVVVPA
jgi:quercetin dioxygenase-like cupin family protein